MENIFSRCRQDGDLGEGSVPLAEDGLPFGMFLVAANVLEQCHWFRRPDGSLVLGAVRQGAVTIPGHTGGARCVRGIDCDGRHDFRGFSIPLGSVTDLRPEAAAPGLPGRKAA